MKRKTIQNFILKSKYYLVLFFIGIIILFSFIIRHNLGGLQEQLEIIQENHKYASIYGSWEVQTGSEEQIIKGTDKYYEAVSKYLALTISTVFSIILIVISVLIILYLTVFLIYSKKSSKH
ncbi:MAG: hypothetical protein ACFFB0_15990 [Promethearchaeota archaeon]